MEGSLQLSVSVFDLPAGQVPRWPTFGIKLSARPEAGLGEANRITGPISFAKALLNTRTGFYDRMHIEASHSVARTIFIDTDAVRPTQFDLPDADRESLYESGRKGATDFLDGTETRPAWNFEQYFEKYATRWRPGSCDFSCLAGRDGRLLRFVPDSTAC